MIEIAIGSHVQLAKRHDKADGIGVVRWFVEPKPGWKRALVFWPGAEVEQFVDVDKLVVVEQESA